MLTEITSKIAKILATEVRVMTVQQLAEHFYAERKRPVECACRAARKLRSEGYAETWPAMVRHLFLERPLLAWFPEASVPKFGKLGVPKFGKLAWQNQKRWNRNFPRKTICLTSTSKARSEFGGDCRTPRSRELEHDVGVAQLYFHLSWQAPQVAASWKHEDSLLHTNEKRPDAVIGREGQPVAIDLLGSGYSREKIVGIWKHFRHTRFELW